MYVRATIGLAATNTDQGMCLDVIVATFSGPAIPALQPQSYGRLWLQPIACGQCYRSADRVKWVHAGQAADRLF